jgi:hypothetical protein
VSIDTGEIAGKHALVTGDAMGECHPLAPPLASAAGNVADDRLARRCPRFRGDQALWKRCDGFAPNILCEAGRRQLADHLAGEGRRVVD